MRRDGFCAEFRDEYDDEAEEACFHEDAERIRDAECHVLFPDEETAFRRRKESAAHEWLLRQDDGKKEQDKKDVGEESGNAGTDTAQGGSSPFPKDKGIVQKAVHREGEEEEAHGNRRRSHGVGQ